MRGALFDLVLRRLAAKDFMIHEEVAARLPWRAAKGLCFPKQETYEKTFVFSYVLLFERETGIEPATPTLARWCSTAEPLAQMPFSFRQYLYYLIITASVNCNFLNCL